MASELAGTPPTLDYRGPAEQYAAYLREQVRFEADFSHASVAALDLLLNMTVGTAPAPPSGKDFQPDPTQQALIWQAGCYVGETFRRLCDGAWRENLNPNSFPYSAGVTAQPNSVSALVFMRLFKRLKYGNEQILPWFESTRLMVERQRKAAAERRTPTPEELLAPLPPGTPPPGARSECASWNNFAIHLNASGLAADAIRFLDRAVALHPGYGMAWFNRGCILADQGQLEEARASWERARSHLDPAKDGATLRQIDEFLQRTASGQPALQVTLLEAVSLVNEGPAGAAKALPTLDHFLRQNPETAIWWVLKGKAHLTLGQQAESQAAYRRALSLSPGDTAAQEGLRKAGG